MANKQVVLLRQLAEGKGMIFRLCVGATGSGIILAEWPATFDIDEAIQKAREYSVAHGLTLIIRRDWLEWRSPNWPFEIIMSTPDGVGTIVNFDAKTACYFVQFDGESEPRPYYASRLRRLRVMYLAYELNRAAQRLVDTGIAGDRALRTVIQTRGAIMIGHSDPRDETSGYREIWQLPDGDSIGLWLSGLYGGAERADAEWSLEDLGVGFDFW